MSWASRYTVVIGKNLVLIGNRFCETQSFVTALLFPILCAGSIESSVGQQTQNLVLNGSFNETREATGPYSCPTNLGRIQFSSRWSTAEGSVDYFNECANALHPKVGVPENIYGFQEPMNGDAYAAVACYTSLMSNAREFLWTELLEPLKGGHLYRISFFFNLIDSANFAVSSIGAFVSNYDTRPLSGSQLSHLDPQAEISSISIMSDKVGWVEVSDTFTANGGELFLTIGCFKSDDEMDVERVADYPESVISSWEISAYYIDSVSIIEEFPSSIVEDEVAQGSVLVFPNPTTGDQISFQYSVSPSAKKKELRILDMGGRLVNAFVLSEISSTIHMSTEGLRKGIYLFELVVDGQLISSNRFTLK